MSWIMIMTGGGGRRRRTRWSVPGVLVMLRLPKRLPTANQPRKQHMGSGWHQLPLFLLTAAAAAAGGLLACLVGQHEGGREE